MHIEVKPRSIGWRITWHRAWWWFELFDFWEIFFKGILVELQLEFPLPFFLSQVKARLQRPTWQVRIFAIVGDILSRRPPHTRGYNLASKSEGTDEKYTTRRYFSLKRGGGGGRCRWGLSFSAGRWPLVWLKKKQGRKGQKVVTHNKLRFLLEWLDSFLTRLGGGTAKWTPVSHRGRTTKWSLIEPDNGMHPPSDPLHIRDKTAATNHK